MKPIDIISNAYVYATERLKDNLDELIYKLKNKSGSRKIEGIKYNYDGISVNFTCDGVFHVFVNHDGKWLGIIY